MDPLEGCLEIGLKFVFEFHISGRSPTNKILSHCILSKTFSYVDHNSLAVVVVVGHWVEVVRPGVLRVLVNTLLLLPRDLGQRPEKKRGA